MSASTFNMKVVSDFSLQAFAGLLSELGQNIANFSMEASGRLSEDGGVLTEKSEDALVDLFKADLVPVYNTLTGLLEDEYRIVANIPDVVYDSPENSPTDNVANIAWKVGEVTERLDKLAWIQLGVLDDAYRCIWSPRYLRKPGEAKSFIAKKVDLYSPVYPRFFDKKYFWEYDRNSEKGAEVKYKKVLLGKFYKQQRRGKMLDNRVKELSSIGVKYKYF